MSTDYFQAQTKYLLTKGVCTWSVLTSPEIFILLELRINLMHALCWQILWSQLVNNEWVNEAGHGWLAELEYVECEHRGSSLDS